MTQTLSVAALGDCLLTRRLRHDVGPAFLRVRRILSRSDVVIGNLEVPLHRLDALPVAQRADFPVVADPALTDDLAFLGLDLMATANNHMYDYGPAGLLSTLDHLARRGILCSGAGRDLTSARGALEAYAQALEAHMQEEEAHILPLYRARVPEQPGGQTQMFLDEHARIRTLLADLTRKVDALAAPAERPDAKSVLALLDQETQYKNYMDHHDRRERAFLYPGLDGVTTEAERAALLAKLGAG